MSWRILCLLSVLYIAAFTYRHFGEDAAWVSIAALNAFLLPLSAIERRLSVILKGATK
jgi:hypothetical protein